MISNDSTQSATVGAPSPAAPSGPDPRSLEAVRAPYRAGLYLQAYQAALPLGPLREWRGTPARLLAGRLAGQLGAPRLANALFLRAWREDRQDPEAAYYRARTLRGICGALSALEFMRGNPEWPQASPKTRSNWLSFQGVLLGEFRDFDEAEAYLARAAEADPGNLWVSIDRAYLLELEDRCEEALEVIRAVLVRAPDYRPGLQSQAHLLVLQARFEEAHGLLERATGRLECASLQSHFATLLEERGEYDLALQALDRLEELTPLREKAYARWLDGRRGLLLAKRGDYPGALTRLRRCALEFHKAVAANLERPARSGRRRVLRLPFIRQHHVTCAPATLATLARFWSQPTDHLELAARICYDGTPTHSQRKWARENGWLVREFTLTWETAVSLIERGIPCAFATVAPTSSHLQALAGYDEACQTLLVRDPQHPYLSEMLAEPLFESHQACGLRAMVLLPAGREALLEGLQLPDAAAYDLYFEFQGALLAHRPAEAQRLAKALEQAAPGHPLAWEARFSLHSYHGDLEAQLAAYSARLTQHPREIRLKLGRFRCLHELSRWHELRTQLEEECRQEDAHPVFWERLAWELDKDGRERPRTLRLARQVLRSQPFEATAHHFLAGQLWDLRRREEALGYYRLAACLNERNERFAISFFQACRHFRQTGRALDHLERRMRRFGRLSGQPARSCYWALAQLNRGPEAFQRLEEGLALRPDDGELILYSAQAYARHGRFAESEACLARARGCCGQTAYARAAAEIAENRGQLAEALAGWREVLQAEPQEIQVHTAVARLLACTDSPRAALAHLDQALAHDPLHFELGQLRIRWLLDEDPEAGLEALRGFGLSHPGSAWARLRLAEALAERRQTVEAWAVFEEALRLEPASAACQNTRGRLLLAEGRLEEAYAAFQEALRLEVDSEFALEQLLELCHTPEARRKALDFVLEELKRQVIFGDSILAYGRLARRSLEAEEALANLRLAHQARADLWQTWIAVGQQLREMNRLEDALALARQATERFPLLPRAWLDWALLCRLLDKPQEEREGLERCLALAPNWGYAARELSEYHARRGEFDAARKRLEDALAFDTTDALTHGFLADLHWKRNDWGKALDCLRRAVELDPGYDWAWERLSEWAVERGSPSLPEELARDLAARRPGEARSWLILARMLQGPQQLEARLAALVRALELNPRNLEAYHRRAMVLAEAGRFAEARAACRPEVFGATLPVSLQGREAWVQEKEGDRPGAIGRLREILKGDPQYFQGWRWLIQWEEAQGNRDGWREAAERLVALSPQDAYAHASLGDALLQLGQRKEAKTLLAKAFHLDPAYGFAGFTLFDLHFEDGEGAEAGRILEALEAHVGGPFTAARVVQHAARQKDLPRALKAFGGLCSDTANSAWALNAAWEALQGSQREGALELLQGALERGTASPRAGRLCLEGLVAAKRWAACERLLELLALQPEDPACNRVWEEAAAGYLSALADQGRHKELRAYLRVHRARLHTSLPTWGILGYAYLMQSQYLAVVEWMRDWRTKPGVAPWMLVNLQQAFATLRRNGEAREVALFALELPEDHTTPSHLAWLAFDEALGGASESAERRLERLRPGQLSEHFGFVCHLARGMVAAARAMADRPESSWAALQAARRELAEGRRLAPGHRQSRDLTHWERRAVWRIARTCRSLWGYLWALYRECESR